MLFPLTAGTRSRSLNLREKLYGSRLAVDMARDAVQAFGGLGLMVELGHDESTYKVEEIYRDAKVGEIYEGSNEIHRMVIAREIFGNQ